MNRAVRNLIVAAFAVVAIAAGSKPAHATVPCPPVCALPPDPSPPIPPINVPDPPFKPTVASDPNNKNHNTAPMTGVMITGTRQAGGECKSGAVSGTLVLTNGKFTCNFMPSTLPVGGACHANGKIGAVTVVDGKRYCKIEP